MQTFFRLVKSAWEANRDWILWTKVKELGLGHSLQIPYSVRCDLRLFLTNEQNVFHWWILERCNVWCSDHCINYSGAVNIVGEDGDGGEQT